MLASEIFEKYRPPLGNFIELLMKWNRAFGFSKFRGADEIRDNLVTPSLVLAGLSALEGYKNVLDLGSGPGIPGLPLAIVRPDLDITLLESGSRQVEFMNLCIKELNLGNCKVLDGRAEKLAHVKGLREEFDIALARSFAPVAIVVETGSAFLKIGGSILIQCTPKMSGELDLHPPDVDVLGCCRTGNVTAALDPDLGKFLTFLSFTKTGSTPEQYPRLWKKMKSDPLF